jgi:hypothetical protein
VLVVAACVQIGVNEMKDRQQAAEIRAIKGPRILSDASRDKIVSRLKELGPKEVNFGVLIGGLEPGSNLGAQLFDAVTAAGWRVVPMKIKDTARGQPAPNEGVVRIVGVVGVKILISEARRDDFFPAATAIVDELNASGIVARTVVVPNDNDFHPDAIHISLGSKT